jgi:hypothetical protein
LRSVRQEVVLGIDDPFLIELRGEDELPDDDDDAPRPRPRLATALAAAAAIALTVVIVVAITSNDGPSRSDRGSATTSTAPVATIPEVPASRQLPNALFAAECYTKAPAAEHLRAVFESIGGFEGLEIGVAEGAYDIVSFDALDHDRLLAAQRRGYGSAENQDVNEQWSVTEGRVTQTAWDPTNPHDFVHYNADGTITMWVHSGDDVGFAPRDAIVFDRSGDVITASSSPMYADRFAVDGGTIFALSGNPDWYAPRDAGYLSLLADNGERRVRLGPGAAFGWIDVPTPGLLVAYPAMSDGLTAVWDTQTLEPLEQHPLAGRPYQRVAISGDLTTALGVTHDGELEPLDLTTGQTGGRFGRVDVTEVERPIVLSADGNVAFSVEKSGEVSVWFVGDDEPVATYAASAGLPRWLPTSRSAARLTSALAPDASRLALRIGASPQIGVSWRLIDTDIESWLARARAVGDDGSTPSPTEQSC